MDTREGEPSSCLLQASRAHLRNEGGRQDCTGSQEMRKGPWVSEEGLSDIQRPHSAVVLMSWAYLGGRPGKRGFC